MPFGPNDRDILVSQNVEKIPRFIFFQVENWKSLLKSFLEYGSIDQKSGNRGELTVK